MRSGSFPCALAGKPTLIAPRNNGGFSWPLSSGAVFFSHVVSDGGSVLFRFFRSLSFQCFYGRTRKTFFPGNGNGIRNNDPVSHSGLSALLPVCLVPYPERTSFRVRSCLDIDARGAPRVSSSRHAHAGPPDSDRHILAGRARSALFPDEGDAFVSRFGNRSCDYRGDVFQRLDANAVFSFITTTSQYNDRIMHIRRIAHVCQSGTTQTGDVLSRSHHGISSLPTRDCPSRDFVSCSR